jgi:hypothetical protein
VPKLLFEIWEDPEDHAFEMAQVTSRADEVRSQVAPKSVLRHSFRASSDFEAHRLNHDWHGWEPWKPEPDWVERFFEAHEADAQTHYLASKAVGKPQ